MPDQKPSSDDLHSIIDVDRVIHEPARLSIMAYLFVLESADFLFLKQQTGLTWGNLSSHISKLEAAGYLKVEKKFIEKKPHTMVLLTKTGREAFQSYQRSIQHIFKGL